MRFFFSNTNKYTTFTNDMLTRLPRVETPGIDRELGFFIVVVVVVVVVFLDQMCNIV